MNPRSYWDAYAGRFAQISDLAGHLGIPYPTIYAVCKGQRGIGRALAERMVAADPSLDASILIWVRPVKPGAQARSQCGSATSQRAA
jgi:hypothetical protein